MFVLRRAAVRAISQQPLRQLSTLRPSSTPRIATFQTSKPVLSRTFHQARIWRAEEDKKDAEELKEEAVAATELAEDAAAAAQEAATDAVAAETPAEAQEAQEVAEGEASIASDAAETAAAASSAAQAQAPPAPAPSDYPPEPPQRGMFPPRDSVPSSGSSAPAPTRILYIGNLFFEVTAAQLEQEFGRYGAITNSRVVTDARGLSKGFGYVEFAEQTAADEAVRQLDQKVFQGRRMAVQFHVRRERRQNTRADAGMKTPSKTLFIGNMSYQMSDRDLNDLFREVKDVLDVRVAIDRRSGQPRGFAHADFIDVPSAQRAKELLEKKVIYGRQLRVDYSEGSSQVKTA